MSRWVHVIGAINVDIMENIPREELSEYVKNKTKRLPKVTGSERNADVYVNVVSGYNSSTWDIETDEKLEFQSELIITIYGDLRDRDEKRTKKELDKLFKYITKKLNWMIDQYSILIDDELTDNFISYKWEGEL